MWVKRLSKPKQASWKAYPEFIMQAILGMDTFKTHIDTTTNKTNIAPFYWTILKSWNILQQINKDNINVYDIRRQWLWMNKHIKINKQEIKWNTWINKGIKLIHDIVDNEGKFLTINELQQKYSVTGDFLKYNSLKDAIPKEWRDKLKGIQVQRNTISSDEPPCLEINKRKIPTKKTTNKMIYWELINRIRITPITKNTWIQQFKLNENSWEGIFEVAKVIRDTKI
jgi:hypothetical protein